MKKIPDREALQVFLDETPKRLEGYARSWLDDPEFQTALRRVSRLKASDMPWLSPEALETFKDAPEVSGPPIYKKPSNWE